MKFDSHIMAMYLCAVDWQWSDMKGGQRLMLAAAS
jgi:hypothetical protein